MSTVAGWVLVGSLAGLSLIMNVWALWVLAKVRMDQGTTLGMLKWIWQRELKKEADYKNGIIRHVK